MMPLLLEAEGNDWKIEIIGKLPDLPPFLPMTPLTTVHTTEITTLNNIEIYDRSIGSTRAILPGESFEPIFFENVAYDVHFERAECETKIQLPIGAEARRTKKHTEHYTINFGNNVGFFEIKILDSSAHTTIKLEVFSRKIDYRTDYMNMRDEISGILRNLAMTSNSRTYGLAAPVRGHNPTLLEWLALIETHFSEFIKLANSIKNNPHNQLQKNLKLVATAKARQINRQTISRALRRENNGAIAANPSIALPPKIAESTSTLTLNTPENKYFKALIRQTYRNLRALTRAESSGDEDANVEAEVKFFNSIRPRLKAMEAQVETLLRSPFLESISNTELIRPKSMVLYKHPLYSRFDKLSRILNGGLSLTDNIIPIGVKETSLLYEYWCFLKIVSLLRDRFDMEEQNILSFKQLKMTITLKKGRQSAIRFIHKPTGTQIFLVYNRLFNKLPTLAQQPDNVIQFASEERFYIFDAKYKIQFDAKYIQQYGGPGPTTEDINTMHRYRDAIAIPHPMSNGEWTKGSVIGALTLFPYTNETQYQNHKFFKSISQVEIGGLPFMPNATKLLEEKLDNILRAQYPQIVDEMEGEESR